MPLNDCQILELPKIHDPRGNLSFIEGSHHVPFDIKRVYYLYDVPGGTDRVFISTTRVRKKRFQPRYMFSPMAVS